ncbi:MAG: glycoside hydrolase family 127 protein [Acidobacteriaceae bacterium]|nr:glycoside hydrolase family 127 protein [Acidobacteriaceae bacterium]
MMTRRELLGAAAVACTGFGATRQVLQQLDYGQVQIDPGPLQTQFEQTHALLMSLDEDSLLRPFRIREGMPAPGRDLGGWYDADGFAPACTFGQWVSALARYYAATHDSATRQKVARLVRAYAATVEPGGKVYIHNRFPAYLYDKTVCGLIDAHQFAGDPLALPTLRRATDAALPYLPPKAMPHRDTPVLHHEDFTEHCWDESYTLPENQFIAWQRTGDPRHRALAQRFLFNDEYFDPLSRNENVLPGRHAYSHVNCLSSAAMAYLVLGDDKYLRAARNGFGFVQAQSFATGGWGPDEHFVPPGSGKLGDSLASQHASFETPCGAYGHFKITRYLLRITRDSRYGDSMERVLYNTVLGAKPLQPDGRAFYYSDYTFQGRKTYHPDKWPCCSGTLPQVAADYRVSPYLRDKDDLYVNLYIPSSVKWNGRSLRQTTAYPASDSIRLALTTPSPATFSIFLRIPEWTRSPRVTVGGAPDSRALTPGAFAEIRREWKTGDRIELELPRPRRLEPVDAQHPNVVALLEGPLVLMAVGGVPSQLTRADLLRGNAALTLKPFAQIQDEPYSTYIRVAS